MGKVFFPREFMLPNLPKLNGQPTNPLRDGLWQFAILSSFTFFMLAAKMQSNILWESLTPPSSQLNHHNPPTTLVFVAKKSRHANLRHATSGLKKVVQMVASAWDHGWMAEDIFIWDSSRKIFRTYRTLKAHLYDRHLHGMCVCMYIYI